MGVQVESVGCDRCEGVWVWGEVDVERGGRLESGDQHIARRVRILCRGKCIVILYT